MQFSWGPLLKDMSRLDTNGFAKSNQIAQKIKQQLEAGEFVSATDSWAQLESVISQNSNSVVIASIVSRIFSSFFLVQVNVGLFCFYMLN